MRTSLVLALAAGLGGILAASSGAEQIAVLAKGKAVALGAGAAVPALSDPVGAQFLAAYQTDLARPAPFDAPLGLAPLPEFGRAVPGAGGNIQFHPTFRGGFVVRVALEGLIRNHAYILCLNGNPQRAGNGQLVDPVPHNERERYYDFHTAIADAQGRYQATLGIALPAGPYDLRFYVKDPDDFKIILYHDFFKFTVEE